MRLRIDVAVSSLRSESGWGKRGLVVSLSSLADRSRRLLPLSVLAVSAALALRRLGDYDTWWHLASGRWIVAHRAIPGYDTLSYTVPDHRWINLQWLYDVVLYGLFSVGGADLLVISAAVSFTLAIWILFKNLRLSLGVVASSLLTLWAIVLAEERFLIRPEMVSFVLLGCVLWLLRTMRRDGGRRLWLLPVLMVVWVNTHALFIVGMFSIVCAAAAVFAARLPLLPLAWRQATAVSSAVAKRLLLAAAASLVATLVNPYFVDGALFPVELLTRIDGSRSVFQAIGEFRSPFSGYFLTPSISAYQLLFFVGISVVVVAAVSSASGSRRSGGPAAAGFDLASVGIFAAIAYVSTLARRNMGLFAIGATPVVAMAAAVIAERLSPWQRRATASLADVAAPVLLVGCVAVTAVVASNGYYRWNDQPNAFGLGVLEANFPIRAAAFAQAAQLPDGLYNDLTAGGYLTWHSGVGGGVFIDGRLEVYDAEFFSDYMSALSRPDAWQRQADEYGVQTVILFHRWGNRRMLMRALLSDPRWSLVYHDEVAVVFVRSAGNETAIRRARELFPAWLDKTRHALARRRAASWQWPSERILALQSYAPILALMGEVDEALALYDELLEIALPASIESSVRFSVAYHLARRGERNQALVHLRRAAALAPDNRRIAQVIADLEQR